jgi:hypothetical protein
MGYLESNLCAEGESDKRTLYPLLYIFGSDLLQTVLNDLMHQEVICWPIDSNDMNFPIIQYADNTLSVMPAEMDQLRALKEVLHKFTLSTSLKIN